MSTLERYRRARMRFEAAVSCLCVTLAACTASGSPRRQPLLRPDASMAQRLERCPRLTNELSADTAIHDTTGVDARPTLLAHGRAVYPPIRQAHMNQEVRIPLVLVVAPDGTPERESVRGPAGSPADSAYIQAAVATMRTSYWCPGMKDGKLVRVRISTAIGIGAAGP